VTSAEGAAANDFSHLHCIQLQPLEYMINVEQKFGMSSTNLMCGTIVGTTFTSH
jgi:hypothetical protein